MRRTVTAATICVTIAACGFPPIINGARFLILSESGADVAQVDFPDQRSCVAAERADTGRAARCQLTTMWDALRVEASADLPDLTRVDAHFLSAAHCEQRSLLLRIGATVSSPCVATAPRRGRN